LMRSAWHIIESCSYDELDDGVESSSSCQGHGVAHAIRCFED
jgi:hypothetical protein